MRHLSTTRGPRKHKAKRKPWNGDTQSLPCLGTGVSGAVFEIDKDTVAKIDLGTQRSVDDIEAERDAYYCFGKGGHPNILRCYELENPNGLVFERCRETVRARLRSKYRSWPPKQETVVDWALQAATGLAFVHHCGVIQSDVGCHNMLFDQNDTLKLADFAGSSVNGSLATVDYELRSKLPGLREPTEKTDLFALGSAMYEMATGRPPYAEKTPREFQDLYRKSRYPALKSMLDLESIILRCWRQEYENAWDVVYDLEDIFARDESTIPPSSSSSSNFSTATTCVSKYSQPISSSSSSSSYSSYSSVEYTMPVNTAHPHRSPKDITTHASRSSKRSTQDQKSPCKYVHQTQSHRHKSQQTYFGISTNDYREKGKKDGYGKGSHKSPFVGWFSWTKPTRKSHYMPSHHH